MAPMLALLECPGVWWLPGPPLAVVADDGA
jgi:hypothetical protein